jgi:uridine kinase
VAIVGGSGAGKTWLANRIRHAFSSQATMLSLDDFYRDRSTLPPQCRARLNFDHPRAIDWRCFEEALRTLRTGRPGRIPIYDFTSHSRRQRWRRLSPKPIILVEGLWLVHRRSLRRWFDWCVFVAAPASLRLRRRLIRDTATRGRTAVSVRDQFRKTVQPMHQRFVASQARWADVVVSGRVDTREIRALLSRLRQAMEIQSAQSETPPASGKAK